MPTTKRETVLSAVGAVLAAISGVTVYHGLDRMPVAANAPCIVWLGGVPSPLAVAAPEAEETGSDGYDMPLTIACFVTAIAVSGLDTAASELYGKVKAALDAADAAQFSGTVERCRDVTAPEPVVILDEKASELLAVFSLEFMLRFHTAERNPYA